MIVSGNLAKAYREAAKISTDILAQVRDKTAAGVYPAELDELASRLCDKYQVKPAFAQVQNKTGSFGHAMCISVNDTVLHGIPSRDKPLKKGDLIKLDFGIIYQKLHTDLCITVGVEKLSKNNRRLLETTKEAVLDAVGLAVAGNKTGDLGFAMESKVKKKGFEVLKTYIGHGIGYSLHEAPQIPAFGTPATGETLKAGMVICIEAQAVGGKDQVYVTQDTWSVKTSDGKNSAMFEYLVRVGDSEPEILTDTREWATIVG